MRSSFSLPFVRFCVTAGFTIFCLFAADQPPIAAIAQAEDRPDLRGGVAEPAPPARKIAPAKPRGMARPGVPSPPGQPPRPPAGAPIGRLPARPVEVPGQAPSGPAGPSGPLDPSNEGSVSPEDAELVAGSAVREIQILTRGMVTAYVTRHEDRWSIHFPDMPVKDVFSILEEVGGPSFSTLEPIERVVRVAAHDLSFADLLKRILDGYSYSFHYKGGELKLVRVLKLREGFEYKPPTAIESRARWADREKAALTP